MQKTPMACRARGRTIIPGRIEVVELNTTIGIGGAQVRPGDIVGCDDDGLIVVPIEVAKEVALHAKAVLIADMQARGRRYEKLGRARDASVDTDAVGSLLRRARLTAREERALLFHARTTGPSCRSSTRTSISGTSTGTTCPGSGTSRRSSSATATTPR